MNHPITPPPELVQQWDREAVAAETPEQVYIATQAARWGANQELEACCVELAWLASTSTARHLRERRRPKPPSLAEEALFKLEAMERLWEACGKKPNGLIRAALERLQELEKGDG